jgi:uncharacterized protein YkwD
MVRRPESRRTWPLAAAAAALALGVAPPPSAALVSPEAEIAAQLRDCANVERAKRNLPTLVHNRVLDRSAACHASNMARYDFSEHTDPWGRGPAERVDRFGSAAAFGVIGENLAAGDMTPADACVEWMRSAGHRANILDPAFRFVGGGFAAGQTALGYYYVQEFGGVGPGAPRASRQPQHGPRVVMRLSQAGDALTLRVDGRRMAVARRGQTLDVPLGRVRPRARITVEVRSVSGELSWGIEQRSDGRRVYRDVRGSGAEATASVVDLATAGPPLVHRVTLDPRGRVLSSFTSPLPKGLPWARARPVASSR